jgi:hypothetical protein
MRELLPARLAIAALVAAALALPGGAAAAPTGIVCTSGTSFDLVAKPGSIETPDGNSVYMWGFANQATGGAFQVSGPNLCVTQGATVTVHLHNALTGPGAEPVSIVFPGQEGVSASGGTAGLFTREAAPGGADVTYTFTASQPGTYLYESGTDPQKQVEMGLYGALVVRPPGCTATACSAYGQTGTQYDPRREYLLVLNEIDPDLHAAVQDGTTYDRGALHNRYFTVNGRSFPDTIQANNVSYLPAQPYGALVRLQPYDATANPLPSMIRLLNAGLLNHPFHPHGNHLRMIAQDGRRFLTPSGGDASTEHFAETIASGSTEDFLLSWRPNAGDPNSPTGNSFPLPVPNYRNLLFKDGNTWYSGSPYLGYKGTLPSGTTSQNLCGEFYFPWHSHALNEFTNYDAGFGGMATLMRVDPLNGCTAFPTSVKLQAGTARSGGFAQLNADDNAYYETNATTTAPVRTDWYGAFTGIPAGATNLTVTYRGKDTASTPPTTVGQTMFIWNWTTSAWVSLGPAQTVGAGEVTVTATAPGSPAAYIGKGASAGQLRVQVVSTRSAGTGTFFTSGDLLKVTYDAP